MSLPSIITFTLLVIFVLEAEAYQSGNELISHNLHAPYHGLHDQKDQVWLVGLVVSYADARLPPKFLKATNNVGKIYNGPYAFSVVPAAPKFLVQASVARKEIHVPMLRPVRKKRRPLTGRRPPHFPPSEYGSYQDYSVPAATNKHPRLRKPPKYRRKPRPPPREPEYYEQENEDEPDDFSEYDYDEKHHDRLKGFDDRPAKRGYSSSSDNRPKGYKKRFETDDEEFLAQHSELYASGYPPGKPKTRPLRFREEEPEHHGPSRIRPPQKFKGPPRPSSKLYSAALPPTRRPYHFTKDEERYRFEDEEEEEPKPRYKKRPTPPEEEAYDESHEKEDHDKESLTGYSRPGGTIHEEYEYNPDNFYHDRKFEPKQKAKRGTEDKTKNEGLRPRPRPRPVESEEDQKHVRETEEDRRTPPRKEPPARRKKQKIRNNEESHPQEELEAKSDKQPKWSIPFRLESEEDDDWEHKGVSERPPLRAKEPSHEFASSSRPKKAEEKPASEHDTASSSWPVIVQGLNWKDPHPAFVEKHPDFMNNWQDFQIPQWPNLDEQLGNLRSTFKWVEPTSQTPVYATTPPNHRVSTQQPPIVVPNMDYSRGIGGQNESRKKKSSKRSKERSQETEVVAQRVVGGTLQLNGAFKPDQTHDPWANPAFRAASNTPGRTPQQQYTVEMFKSVEPGKTQGSDIVYGTRINDSKSKKIEPDIGYHSGMETIDDDIGSWQFY